MKTCFECGNDSLTEAVVEMNGERNGQKFCIEMDGYRCNACGYQAIDSDQSEEFTRKLSDAYRSANGLLTGAEIRARRTLLRMTQQEFAAYLGPGVASVRRWELGQIQDKAMDQLIRLKTDPVAARHNLRTVSTQVAEQCVVSTMVIGGVDLQLSYTSRQLEEQSKTPIRMDEVDFRSFALDSVELLAA